MAQFTNNDIRQANEASDPKETFDDPNDYDAIGKDLMEEKLSQEHLENCSGCSLCEE